MYYFWQVLQLGLKYKIAEDLMDGTASQQSNLMFKYFMSIQF
jgi:hypothetical protein